jgi:ATP-binding protein involved in chromosome partitioning
VVVTTPHRASQQVAVRAAQMARKTNMRLLGVVENMAYLEREDGSREELFGSGGGESLAAEVEAPLLGRIPFDPRLGALADEGEPIVLAEPDAVVSRAIVELAEAIAATRREQGVGIVKPLPLVAN